MKRSIFGVVVGFLSWLMVLITGEQILSLLLPEQFGKPQAAFQKAIEEGGTFAPQSLHLLLHVSLAIVACILAGMVVAAITRKRTRASLVLGCLLLAVGLLKAGLTWQLVPIWYHAAFTGVLFPATLIGGTVSLSRRGTTVSATPPSSIA